MEEEAYDVAIQVVVFPGSDYSELETKMEEACNAITLPAINCTTDIQFVWISELNNTTSMAVAGDEKIDIISVATVQTLSTISGSEMLYDLDTDNLLASHGPVICELFADTLNAGYVNGQQLAIPAQTTMGTRKGIYYNKTYADKYGITVPEKLDIETLTDIFDQIAAADDGDWTEQYGAKMTGWFAGGGTLNQAYWLYGYAASFGTEGSYGIIRDESNMVVENLYASDLFKEYCEYCYRWRQNGEIKNDSTDSESSQSYIANGTCFCTASDLNPTQEANFYSTGQNNGFEIGFAYFTEPAVTASNVTEYMWGVATNSERPDKCVDFLNLLYSNADLANILMYGLEGENYEKVSDTQLVQNGSYSASFYRGGNTLEMMTNSTSDTYFQDWEDFMDGISVSKLVAYSFDDTDFQTESSVLNTTITKYLPMLQNGTFDSEDEMYAWLDEFNAALESAGINDVIAANQAQLDAYLEAIQ